MQGPLSRALLEAAAQASLADLPYYGRRGLRIGTIDLDVSRTGYTGDLGYELWVSAGQAVALWDALIEAGAAYGLRPAGILALDVARVEAGLIMAEVDYTSAWHAQTPAQTWSPFELGLGRLVDLDKEVPFVGRSALRREHERGGPPRRLVGLDLDWVGPRAPARRSRPRPFPRGAGLARRHPRLRRRRAGRPCHERDLEPSPQAQPGPRHGGGTLRRARHGAPGGVDASRASVAASGPSW